MNPTQQGEAATPAINTSKRLFDLVRFMRSELHTERLITDGEYEWLCTYVFPGDPQHGSPSPRRLEDYDDLRTKFAALEAQRKAALEEIALKHNLLLDWQNRYRNLVLIAEQDGKDLSTLRTKLAEAEKDAERLAGALERMLRAFVTENNSDRQKDEATCVTVAALALTPEQALKEKEGAS